jgi:hypothetical protein
VHQSPVGHLVQFQRLGHGQHAGGGDPDPGQLALPLQGGPGAQVFLQGLAQGLAVGLAVLALGEAGVARQFGRAHDRAQRLELLLLVGGDVERAVGGGEGARGGRRGVLVADGDRLHTRGQVVGHPPAHRGDRGLQHGHVHAAPPAGALPPDQGGADREGCGEAAQDVGDGEARAQGAGAGRAGGAHHPRQALDDLVVGRAPAQGAVGAEPGHRAVDQAGVDRAQVLPAEAQALQHARPEVLQQHVGAAHQAGHGLPAAGGLQVQGQGALARVLRQERRAQSASVQLRRGAELACQVTGSGDLDLDHVGAHERQLVPGVGSGQDVGHVQDAHPRERQGPLPGLGAGACVGVGQRLSCVPGPTVPPEGSSPMSVMRRAASTTAEVKPSTAASVKRAVGPPTASAATGVPPVGP